MEEIPTVLPAELTAEKLIEMYKMMVLIRTFENRLKELFTSGEIVGDLHLSIGQEAVPVGICSCLRSSDYLTSHHRGHGHCLAKGSDVNRTMAEFFGKKAGLCLGKGGSLHLADFSVGMLGATPIVGGGIPIAVGGGLASKLQKTDRVTVSLFGDGATSQGTFHESLNLASIWSLPVVFVCENNQYAESTRIEEASPVKVFERALAYAIPGVAIDGMDVLAVYEAIKKAVQRARAGKGPTLVEAVTYRYEGHELGDPFHLYQSEEELAKWKQRDPIPLFATRLTTAGVLDTNKIEQAEDDAKRKVEEAVNFARATPEPEIEEAFRGVFVSPYY